jgi:hypothetical protein
MSGRQGRSLAGLPRETSCSPLRHRVRPKPQCGLCRDSEEVFRIRYGKVPQSPVARTRPRRRRGTAARPPPQNGLCSSRSGSQDVIIADDRWTPRTGAEVSPPGRESGGGSRGWSRKPGARDREPGARGRGSEARSRKPGARPARPPPRPAASFRRSSRRAARAVRRACRPSPRRRGGVRAAPGPRARWPTACPERVGRRWAKRS